MFPDRRKEVLAGATLLDLNVPGWYKKIDLSSLRVSCPWNCILHQLFKDVYSSPTYSKARTTLGISSAYPMGFACSERENDYMKELWGEQIQIRLNNEEENENKDRCTEIKRASTEKSLSCV